MSDIKEIKTALISVFHKDGLDEILRLLNNSGVKFISTGGTRDFIRGLGYDCEAVEDLTGLPLDSRRPRENPPSQNFRRHPQPPRQRR